MALPGQRQTHSLVVSKPAELFRARLRVLMTSPLGRTTVCQGAQGGWGFRHGAYIIEERAGTDRLQEPLGLSRTVSNGIRARAAGSPACGGSGQRLYSSMSHGIGALATHIMPPTVAP